MSKHKTTKKEFIPYNDYVDRPFGLKWGTAFAIDELKNAIKESEDEFNKNNEVLPLMEREEIDEVLQFALLKSKILIIQLNVHDKYDNIIDIIEGKFQGFSDRQYLYIDNNPIEWELIRNVRLK